MDARNKSGAAPDLLYGIAVCHYSLQEFSDALKFINELIEYGIREHPELCKTGSESDVLEHKSVGNSQALRDTFLVEAYNLRAAIEYRQKECI